MANQDRVDHTFSLFQREGVCMYHTQRQIYQTIAQNLYRGASVLDAGCGAGLGTAMLHVASGAAQGIDLDERGLQLARQLYPWLPFELWDIRTPYPHQFSVVVCVEVVEHVEPLVLALDNLVGICGRELWLSTPNALVSEGCSDHVREYTPKEMLSLLRTYGRPSIVSYDPVDLAPPNPVLYKVAL
jgi:2-polyprenyl-3-methyl-5-hydroxy-6-metoxy-1,4-benzoquinol methylase